MKTTTLNTNGLENEGFRELTAKEMTDCSGGLWFLDMIRAKTNPYLTYSQEDVLVSS